VSLDIAVTGYQLFSDNGQGNFDLIYKSDNVQVLSFTHWPLTTGTTYSYYIQALNFNGPSEASPIASRPACSAPTQFLSLEVTLESSAFVTLEWRQPANTGGCFVDKYEVYRDDGLDGPFVLQDSLAASTYAADVTGLVLSLQYRFKIAATNSVGKGYSNIVVATLADLPS
jgi:hypothetical protein